MFRLINVYALLHDEQQERVYHQLSQSENGSHDGVYEPEHLVDMYVSLDYSNCLIGNKFNILSDYYLINHYEVGCIMGIIL